MITLKLLTPFFREKIARVPAGEQTWDKARKEIAADLSGALTGKEAVKRAELLLRTHVFRSYAVTRYRLLMAQRDVFPFWQYKTHGDGRVRPSHAALNGKILPAGHPVWQKIFPPWDWGCRCLVVPLTRSAVEQRRGEDEAKAPEDRAIWDGDVADAIDVGDRLPGGVSILRSQTWADSPWSETGTMRHTWELIRERYASDPAALAAFEQWATKTEVLAGWMVSSWIGGRKPGERPAWSPSMTRAEAEEWAAGSVMTGPVYHGTEGAESIRGEGADVSPRNVWYAAGHYVGEDAEYAAKFPLEHADAAKREVIEQRISIKNPFRVATREAFNQWLKKEGIHNMKRSRRGAKVRDILRERGFDGIVIDNELEGGRNSGRVFVAFDKEQVITIQS